MMINYDWYTTNYRHAAAYATLIVKATVYTNPSRSTGFQKFVDFIF